MFNQAPETTKKPLSDICVRLSSECSKVLKESSTSIKSMRRSGTTDIFVGEMNAAVQKLHSCLLQQQTNSMPLTEALPAITIASLLIEIAKRVEGVVEAVNKLAAAANFKHADDEKPNKSEAAETVDVIQVPQV